MWLKRCNVGRSSWLPRCRSCSKRSKHFSTRRSTSIWAHQRGWEMRVWWREKTDRYEIYIWAGLCALYTELAKGRENCPAVTCSVAVGVLCFSSSVFNFFNCWKFRSVTGKSIISWTLRVCAVFGIYSEKQHKHDSAYTVQTPNRLRRTEYVCVQCLQCAENRLINLSICIYRCARN